MEGEVGGGEVKESEGVRIPMLAMNRLLLRFSFLFGKKGGGGV